MYKSQGFKVDMILCDNEGGIFAAKKLLNANEIVLNLSSPGQHVPIIERTIRTVKERVRAIISTLPFRVPFSFMKYLISFVVMRINSTTRGNNVSPRELFTGRKLNYKKDLKFGFGDYAQVEIPNVINKNSVRIPRTEGAIAICSTGNLQGSVTFYLLSTGKFVNRDNFKILPMPKEVVERLNDMAGQSSRSQRDVLISYREEDESEYSSDYENEEPDNLEEFQQPVYQMDGIDPDGIDIIPDQQDDEGNQVLTNLETEVLSPVIQSDQTGFNETENVVKDNNDQISHRYPQRVRKQTERFGFHMSVEKSLKKYEKETIQAIIKELQQMLDKKVFQPVFKGKLTNKQKKKVSRSFCFMKEKFYPDGKFDKLKARLTMRGDLQYETMMDISSPTVSLSAVLMVAA
jgi:hypothetical protein